MCCVTFVVSTFGSFGSEAQGLMRAISWRVGHSVPASLLGEASWAAPRFAPYMRMAQAYGSLPVCPAGSGGVVPRPLELGR